MATIAIAADHAGLLLKAELVTELSKLGHQISDLGPHEAASVDYPDFAVKVAQVVASQPATLGILVCGTGIGMSITANKVHGVRAALCRTEFEARMSRQHNDANVLCLGQRVTGMGLALEIAKAFVGASFEGGRHAMRVDKMRRVEGGQ